MQRFRPYTLEEGKFLVKLARKAVEHYLIAGERIRPPEDTPERFYKDKYGVFTTIEIYEKGKTYLRGCIGFPYGYQNMIKAIIESALAAAFEDPRFPPLSKEELDQVIFEISILSPIQQLKVDDPREYPRKIKVGYHGLIIEKGIFSGLLLPQVPVEYGWNEEEFLCQTCMKAGLTPECWLDRETRVYIFQAQIFKEIEPKGEVIERDLLKELEEKRK